VKTTADIGLVPLNRSVSRNNTTPAEQAVFNCWAALSSHHKFTHLNANWFTAIKIAIGRLPTPNTKRFNFCLSRLTTQKQIHAGHGIAATRKLHFAPRYETKQPAPNKRFQPSGGLRVFCTHNLLSAARLNLSVSHAQHRASSDTPPLQPVTVRQPDATSQPPLLSPLWFSRCGPNAPCSVRPQAAPRIESHEFRCFVDYSHTSSKALAIYPRSHWLSRSEGKRLL
jgi:hypothetical protein